MSWAPCRGLACVATLALAPGPSLAQQQASPAPPATAPKQPPGPATYPSKGQSPEQQAKDKSECTTWATGQTGFDPTAAPTQQKAQGSPQGGGAAKGAAAGAAVGAISGHAGRGAAVGAAAGGTASGKKKQQQAAAQQQAQAQQVGAFQKAFGACMQGRGYSVSG